MMVYENSAKRKGGDMTKTLAALVALFHRCGLDTPERIEPAFAIARWPATRVLVVRAALNATARKSGASVVREPSAACVNSCASTLMTASSARRPARKSVPKRIVCGS